MRMHTFIRVRLVLLRHKAQQLLHVVTVMCTAKYLDCRCASLEGDMHKLQKDVDLTAIDKFVEKDREYNERKEELDHVAEERNSARDEYEGLRKLRQDEFSAGFKIISDQLKDMYEMITNGGNAELEMVDSMDPFAEVGTYVFPAEWLLQLLGVCVLFPGRCRDFSVVSMKLSATQTCS